MGKLFEKLETLVDEVTALVREERVRRAQPWPYGGMHIGAPDFYGPRGTEFRLDANPLDRTGCAPNIYPQWSSTVNIGEPKG